MYFSAKVKMLEHASNIVKRIFQIRKIILPNPEILFLHHVLQSTRQKTGQLPFFFLLKLICGYFPLAGVFLMRKG